MLRGKERGPAQDEDKVGLARASLAWNQRQPQLAAMFPQLRSVPASGEQAAAPAAAPAEADGAAEAGGAAHATEHAGEADWAAVRIAEARLAEGDPAAAVACIDRALKCAATCTVQCLRCLKNGCVL